MFWASLAVAPIAFLLSAAATGVVWRLGHRLSTFDAPGVRGQVKLAPRRVPNTGGIGIFIALCLPLVAILLGAHLVDRGWIESAWPEASRHVPGVRASLGEGLTFVACLAVLHALGLVDDRRPLGPWLKLGTIAACALGVATFGGTRLLELLDARTGGPWLSISITALWLIAITNAMNFMDNMDGLSAGTGAIAAACFLAIALRAEQWFVAGALSLLVGTLAGFLLYNAPRRGGALIFMGDGGSLVLGFALGVLSVRTTYLDPGSPASPWFAVFVPLAVLAIPLYDFASVVVIRLAQGRSPFLGDLQHFSHRIVRLGLSRRSAVAVIWGCAAITGFTGIMLPSLPGWQAILAGVQIALIVIVLALFEWSHARSASDPELAPKP